MEVTKDEIRRNLFRHFKSGINATEATRNICSIIGPDAVSKPTAYRWYAEFKQGDYSLQDLPRSGRPTVIHLDELKQAIETEPTLSTRDVARKVGCSQYAVRYHFKKFGLKSKLGGWAPHELTPAQKKKRVEVCQQLLNMHRKFNWLDKLITGDEKWVLHVNIQRRRQWLKSGQTPKLTAKPDLHPQKRMLCVWWGVKGVHYWELLNENTTITANVYSSQISKLEAAVKRRDGKAREYYFLHDNARPHIANLVKNRLEMAGWKLLPHPPYSCDIAPSDYHLFRGMANGLKQKIFKNEDELKNFIQDFFDSKPSTFYAAGIHMLPKRWQQVIDSGGEYIQD